MRVRVIGAATAAAALLLVGCGGDGDSATTISPSPSASSVSPSPTQAASATPSRTGTVVDLAAGTPELSTLATAVTAAGLDGTLNGAGPFTLFAPTNEAFDELPAGVLDKLLKPENKDALTSVLTFHVVPRSLKAAAIKSADVATVNGEAIALGTTGGVTVNNGKVVKADLIATNGVVHVIDVVLLPPGFNAATLK